MSTVTWITDKELEGEIEKKNKKKNKKKKQRRRILLQKQHENFTSAVRIREMLAVSKKRQAR